MHALIMLMDELSSVPQDINKLFNWHHEEYLSNVEMIPVVCAIDLKDGLKNVHLMISILLTWRTLSLKRLPIKLGQALQKVT